MQKMIGNTVTYEIPVKPRSRWFPVLAVALVLIAGACGLAAAGHQGGAMTALLGGLGSLMFGANTVAYEYPVSGATAPTAAQNRTHQSMSAIVTGDGAATSFVITHNWGLSSADLTNGFPWVQLESILASGNTAAAIVTTKATNSVTFTCTAFSGAGLRVRLERPWSALR